MPLRPRTTLSSIVQFHKARLKDKVIVRKGAEELLKKPVKSVNKLS